MRFESLSISPKVPPAARDILQSFRPEASLPLQAVVGVIGELSVAPLLEMGLTDLHNLSCGYDAWEIQTVGKTLFIVGASPRGTMQGVFDFVLHGGNPELKREGVFPLKYRIHALLVGGMTSGDYSREEVRENVKFLALSGASHIAATNDWGGDMAKSFFAYVKSDIFPKACPESERVRLHQRLRDIIDAAKYYGMGILFETILMPAQGDRTELENRFSSDVVSASRSHQSYYLDWCLCLRHPKIRAFYSDIIAKFFHDFPEIELLHYITLDAGGEFCDEETCPRCHGANKFELHDEASRFLYHEAAHARPGIQLLNSAYNYDRNDFGLENLLIRQGRFEASIGLCMSATGDSATSDRQSHDYLRLARKITAEKGQLFLGRDAFFFFDDVWGFGSGESIADYPLGMARKTRRWLLLGADGYYDVRGRANLKLLYLNGPALRLANLDPLASPQNAVAFLAREGFGTRASQSVEAWQAVEQAQCLISNGLTFPSDSTPWSQFLGWLCSAPVPVPDEPLFGKVREPDHELPPCATNGWVYHEGDYPHRLEVTGNSLSNAAPLFHHAAVLFEEIARAGDVFTAGEPFLLWMPEYFQWDACEYAAEVSAHYDFLAKMYALGGLAFRLRSIFLSCGRQVGTYRHSGDTYLREYASAARALADFLAAPPAPLAMLHTEFQKWSEVYRQRARQCDSFLKN